MPRRKRPGEWAVVFAEVAPELKAWLEAQARANHRSATGELILLLESYLDPQHKPARKPRREKS